MKKKVTGIGGVFFKCKNPEAIKEWYKKHLGMNCDDHGVLFVTPDDENPAKKSYLQWSPFAADTDYFEPSKKEFMINYTVEGIESLVDELKASGVEVLDEIAEYPYGKFVHILDPEGNKIELWEPVENAF